MGRAKPKKQYSLEIPTIQAPPLSERTRTLLLDDVNLDRRKDAARCESFLTALDQHIGRYFTWQKVMQEIPSLREQSAELRRLERTLRPALNELSTLSPLSRRLLTHTYADAGIGDVSHVSKLARCIDAAHAALSVLVGVLNHRPVKNLGVRRGRRPESVHILIQDLATLFATYETDDHDDDSSRRSARDAFIRRALNIFHIRAPRRFDDILREK